jgi:hypothetical protein
MHASKYKLSVLQFFSDLRMRKWLNDSVGQFLGRNRPVGQNLQEIYTLMVYKLTLALIIIRGLTIGTFD